MSERLTKLKKIKGKRKHGFLKRNASANGRNLIKRRKLKGRKKV